MSVQLVGPVLARDAEPVAADLHSFLSQGLPQGHGAVYVSMGTLARMNHDELHSLAQALSALPNPVLWKLNPHHLPGCRYLSSYSHACKYSSCVIAGCMCNSCLLKAELHQLHLAMRGYA